MVGKLIADILFFPIAILLVVLDFLIALITFSWLGIFERQKELREAETKLRSVPVGKTTTTNGDDDDDVVVDETHRVHPCNLGELRSVPKEGVDTLYKVAMHGFENFPDCKCQGTREYLGYWKGNPKIKHFGDNATWRTYHEVDQLCHQFGAACVEVAGLQAAPDTTTIEKNTLPCRLAIFENTCAEWTIACIGAFSQSISVTTIYATLGFDAVLDVIDDNSITTIVCNKRNVQDLLDKLPHTPTLQTIIYTNDHIGPDDHVPLPPQSSVPPGIQIFQFYDFVARGNPGTYPPVPPKPTTIAVIMYTSGSTGKPKGAVLTHAAAVAAGASAEYVTKQVKYPPVYGKEVIVSYLPLAHIFALMVEFGCLYAGCAIGYADPKSLSTDTQAKPLGALEFFRPTNFVAVPKIWDILKKMAIKKVESRPYISQYIFFNFCYPLRKLAVKYGYDTPLFNLLVFRRFKNGLGGRVRYAVSGGGPLNGDVQEFCRNCFQFTFVQGYGLTETCAALTCQEEDDHRTGVVGCIAPGNEVKLESTPDIMDKHGLPYLQSDRFDVNGNPIWGRGEILARGKTLFSGYYMMPDVTKEVLTDDPNNNPWFHTGDIGQFTKDGSIQIIDRKKNLVKLKGGEYIALEQMEMVYNNSIFVDNIRGGVCCYGDGDMDRPVALVQLQEDKVMQWAIRNGHYSVFKLIQTLDVTMDAIMKDFHELHAKSGLSHLEKLAAVAFVTSSEWTPENGCLTAANKLNRNFIIRTFEKEFHSVKKKGIFD